VAGGVRLGRTNTAVLRALERHPAVLAQVDELVATPLAERMAQRAPRDSETAKDAADTIRSEPDPDVPGFRVSWTTEGFYLTFAELGTRTQPATPFARPTADEFIR